MLDVWIKALIFSMMLVMLVSVLAVLLLPYLRNKLLPNIAMHKLSDNLQIKAVLDDGATILNKDGSLSRVLVVAGLDLSTKTLDELEVATKKRHQWLQLLAKYAVNMKLITLRDRAKRTVAASFNNEVLTELHKKTMLEFANSFRNRHFIVFTHYPEKKRSLLFWNPQQAAANINIIDEWEILTREVMHDYGISTLNLKSGLLPFLGQLINGQTLNFSNYNATSIDQTLSLTNINFNSSNGLITTTAADNPSQERFSKIVSLYSWSESSSCKILQDILALPIELTILQIATGFGKLLSEAKLREQYKQDTLYRKPSNVVEAYEAALELIVANNANLYTHQLSIVVKAATETELSSNLSLLNECLRGHGINPVTETYAAECVWRTQLPGADFMVRPNKLLSSNIAHFAAFSAEPLGRASSDWSSSPLCLLKTASGSAYNFQLHQTIEDEALANALIVAPAGSGKTTFITYLAAVARYIPELRVYLFDRAQGAKISTLATGGYYAEPASNSGLPLNFLCCDDNISNRNFINSFIRDLSNMRELTSDIESSLNRAIDIIFQLPQEQRILTNLLPALFQRDNPLAQKLQQWTADGADGRWFNGSRVIDGNTVAFDGLDLTASQLIAFEMTEILKHEHLSVVAQYIMHRIRSQMPGCGVPHLVVIDEAAQMLRSETFRRNVKDILQEHRKLRGATVLCFQDSKDITESPLCQTLLNQCPTRILYPNPSAEYEHYSIFKLTDSEWSFIKGTHPASSKLKRPVLIKTPFESVMVDVDLKFLGKYLQIFRSGSEKVKQLHQLERVHGAKWLEYYLKSAA